MKCDAGSFLSRLCKAVSVLSVIFVFLFMTGCDMWNKDMLGYLQKWTETVQVGRVELSDATIQKNDSGADTIPVAAVPTITGYIINPQGYSLDFTVGDESSATNTVRVSSAILSQTKVVSSDSTMIAVKLAAADESLEHTSFIVSFVPVRTDNMQSAPTGKEMKLRYNTPSLPPARVNQVVAEDGSVSYAVVKEGELWKAAADGNLYWAWDDSVTDEKSSKFAKWFEVGGVRHLLADCKVSPETKVGTRSLFCRNTGNVSTSLAAVDGEGVSSPTIASGTFIPAGSDVTGPESVSSVVATYSADGSISVVWTDPVDTDGDLQEIVVSLGGGTVTKSPMVVAKGVQQVQFTGIPGDGKLYTVTVVARDTSGNESVPVSVQVLADATAPAPVTELAASYNKDTQSIVVHWKDPVDTDGDLHEIEVILTSNASEPVIKGVPLKDEVVSFTGITEDRTQYTVTVMSVDATGNRSIPSTIHILADASAPASVTNLTASYDKVGTSITVNWKDPVDKDLERIEVSLEGKGSVISQFVQKGIQSATFTGIIEDRTKYTITVVAMDASGNRSATETATVVADKTGPGAVSGVDATYSLDSNGNSGTIQVTWTDPDNIDGDLEEIVVTLSNGNAIVATKSSAPQGNGMVSFPDIPDNRTEYTITVVALDASGNESAAVTEKVVADKTGPGAVTNVQASSGETTVTLTWTNPSANDFSHVAVTSNPSLTTGSITVHSQTAGSQGSATITGLTSGTEYTFTIITEDDLGNSNSSTHFFTWQKLTLNSIIGSGFTKDNVEVAGVSGNTLVLYYLKGSTVQQTVYNAYKPKADGNTFDWWKDTTAGNQQTDPITMDSDVTLIANYSAVSASKAVNYIATLTKDGGPYDVVITGAISESIITGIRDVSGVKYGTIKINLDLSGTTGLTTLPPNAFKQARGLESVKLPDTITELGLYSFYQCFNLKSVNIPTSVTAIPNYAFGSCNNLSTITIPEGVETIQLRAFSSCSSLVEVVIPRTVKSIGEFAFEYCDALQKVEFRDTNGWVCTQTTIDAVVTNPTDNATSLKDSSSQYSTYGLTKS